MLGKGYVNQDQPKFHVVAYDFGTKRNILLMLVILPFWTSFLIRVYAWIGILKPEGLLNQFLQAVGCAEAWLRYSNVEAMADAVAG